MKLQNLLNECIMIEQGNYLGGNFSVDLAEAQTELNQAKQLLIQRVVSSAVECRHNSQQEKLNYLKWVEFAESEVAKGNKQTQCSKCKKWYFPSEL